jgi:hypothetical protein
MDGGGRVRVSSTSDPVIRDIVGIGVDHGDDRSIHRWWTVMGV